MYNNTMTDVSGSSFANAVMLNSNPFINQSYDTTEFDDPVRAYQAPVSHAASVEAYKSPGSRRRNIHGFVYDDKVSNRRTAVYHDPRNKRTLLAHRGTQVTSPRDIATDVALTFGGFKKTKHYKDQVKKFQEVYDKYGAKNTYHLTGHSLGGHLQPLHSRFHKTVKSAVSFNPPGSTSGIVSSGIQRIAMTPAQRAIDKSHANFIHSLDPVSILSRHRKNKKGQSKFTLNPHSLDQWAS